MKHILLPKSDDFGENLWNFDGYEGLTSVCLLPESYKQITIETQSDFYNEMFNSSCELIIVGSFINDSRLKTFWEYVFCHILKCPENWCIWWHSGGGGEVVDKSADTIRQEWEVFVNNLFFLNGENEQLKSQIKKLQPFLYSEGGRCGDWDDVIKKSVRPVFKTLLNERDAISVENFHDLIESMDACAKQAKRKYLSIVPLQKDLAKLLPYYIELLEMSEPTNDSQNPETTAELLAKIKTAVVTHAQDASTFPLWLDAIYEDLELSDAVRIQKQIPTRAEVTKSLEWFQRVESFENPADLSQCLQLLKRLFQLLNIPTNDTWND